MRHNKTEEVRIRKLLGCRRRKINQLSVGLCREVLDKGTLSSPRIAREKDQSVLVLSHQFSDLFQLFGGILAVVKFQVDRLRQLYIKPLEGQHAVHSAKEINVAVPL